MSDLQCPLCEQTARGLHAKVLYGQTVCQSCSQDFARRRQQAFAIDFLLINALVVMGSFILSAMTSPLSFTGLSPLLFGMMLGVIGYVLLEVSIVLIVIVTLSNGLSIYDQSNLMTLLIVGRLFVVPMLLALRDAKRGQSYGKRLMKIQVIDQYTHRPIGIVQSVKRNLCLFLPTVPSMINMQLHVGLRMGDRWANTKVIDQKKIRHPLYCTEHLCQRCLYNLRGNTTGVCPECGAVVKSVGQDQC
jgi:uncharacterized RDD family membrane protein YckC